MINIGALNRTSAYMITLENLSKMFGGNRVLDAVSLTIPDGMITALIGPNGAGKTTLFDTVSGFVRHDNGAIFLNGKNISTLLPFQRAREGIARTFQHVRLADSLSLFDHWQMVRERQDESLAQVFFQRKGLQSERFAREQCTQGLAALGLEKDIDTCVHDLSYGQRKLLDLGLALFRPHTILLLDEPVAGVHQVIRRQIHKCLTEIQERHETVVLIEHDIEFVRAIADRVVVLDEGRVLMQGEPDEVLSDKRVLEAYLGD